MKCSYRVLPSAALLAAGLGVGGLGVAGCQISEHAHKAYEKPPVETSLEASEQDTAAEEIVQEETGPTIRRGQTITIGDEAIPNPAEIGPFTTRNDHLLRRFYTITRPQCDGFVARQPAVILDAPEGFEHLRIDVEGEAQVLFVEMPGREHRCVVVPSPTAELFVEGRNWPAGTYRVFVGGPGRLDNLTYSLAIEDMTRPATVRWLQSPLPTIEVDGSMAAPRFARQDFGEPRNRSAAHGDTSCISGGQELTYPLEPDVKLEVRQGMNLVLGARSDVPGHITLLGPVPEDQRDIPTRCLTGLTQEVSLTPGDYYIRYGVAGEVTPQFLDVFAHAPSAQIAPLTRGDGDVPAGLGVEARRLTTFYPFLDVDSLLASDQLRQQLFLAAAPELFVAPAQDLSTSSPASLFMGPSPQDADLRDAEAQPQFPRAGEPLLLLNEQNIALAADGSLFVVAPGQLIVLEEAENVALPAQVRNPQTYFEQAIALADTQDQGQVQYYRERKATYDECVADTFARVQDRVARLMVDEDANRDQIDRIRLDTQNRAERTCGYAQLQEDRERLWQDLETNRTQRRQQMLDQVRSRFQNR